MVKLKRAYEPPCADDGERFLVDRLWPRGLRRGELSLAGWLKDLAPSDELRRWFGHDSTKWPQFCERYRQELQMPEKQALLRILAQKAQEGTVTLVYAAQDKEHNNAVVLKQLIDEMIGRGS